MGSSTSKTQLREPPVTGGAAIWRRLQIWEGLKPYLTRVMKAIGLGGRRVISKPPTPTPPGDPSPVGKEDEVVTKVERMLVQALRAIAADEDVDDQPAMKRTSLRAIRALKKRLAVVDLVEPKPGPGRDDHDHDHDGGHDEGHDHDDEALVAKFVRSSLDIALPRIEERDSDGQLIQRKPASPYSEENSSVVPEGTTPSPIVAPNASSSSSATPHPAVLPAAVQEELNTKLSNYLTWDKKLYANLRLDSESIRLVEIRPGRSSRIEVDLIKRPLDEVKNAYEALSYTWGSPSPKETIVVNGVQVQINQWLFGALSSLRLPNTKRCLWVDAICINQANVAERSNEVQKMGDIYRLAKTVVIFHGWPSTTTGEGSWITALFKFLTRPNHNGTSNIESSAQTAGAVDDPFRSCGLDKALVCKGFIDLCCRPWWRRVWTMQEFYLATDEPVWYWGSTGVSNTALKRDMPLLMTASWELYGQKVVESWIPGHIETSTGKPVAQFSAEIRRISDLISRRYKTHGFDIPSRLYRSLSAQATDPRDLVYGLREVFDPVFRRVFVPDYFMRLELLYACLAVFLIQFEGWGDVLWWYPHRFEAAKGLSSWLPDFTKRVVPAATERLPQDHLAASTLQLKLVVLNHTLLVEGYELDTIEAFTSVIKGDEMDVLRDLWKFDGRFNRNRSYLNYVATEEEQKNPSLKSFLAICRTLTSQDDSGIAHPRLSVLGWTVKSNTEADLPSTVAECLPCWDILMWHAFKTGSKSVSELLNKGNSTTPGLLTNIFSSNLNDAFRAILATDFIGDCVFDWPSLEHTLDLLASASPWSDPTSPYWQQTPAEPAPRPREPAEHRDQDLSTRVSSFLASLKAPTSPTASTTTTTTGDLHRFHTLCSLVLLDSSSSHASFARILDALRSAGEQLHGLALDSRVRAQVDALEARDEVVVARVRWNGIVKTHFSGRTLFWTRRGFHGLMSPGTELRCEGARVLLLDGLSFPMVVRGFDHGEGSGRLVGCAVVRGVDLFDGKAKSPKGLEIPEVPEGFALGEKRLFKFT